MNSSLIKRFILITLTAFSLIAGFFILNYSSSKSELEENFKKDNLKHVDYMISSLQEKFLLNNKTIINDLLEVLLNTTNISYINIDFKNYLFTKEALIRNSKHPEYLDWNIDDVVTDIKNGYVKLEENNYYKLHNNNKLDTSKPLFLKFYLFKNDSVINSISNLNFFYEKSRENLNLEEVSQSFKNRTDLYFFDQKLAEVEYFIDDSILNSKIEELFDDYLYYYLITMLAVSFVIFLIYYIFVKNVLIDTIKMFKEYLYDVVENNYIAKTMPKSGDENIDETVELINKILKKYSSVLSELNINKDILERKVFTDDLTGLSNQKVFELDLKNMFIVGTSGFIASIKIDYLGSFTKEFGSALANHLIEEFAHTIQNKFYEHSFNESNLYRFFGSEFAIIIKNQSDEEVLAFCADLEEELTEVEQRYEVKGKLAYWAVLPFDKYGTINSILHSITDAYNEVKESGKTYHVTSSDEVIDKFKVLEQSISNIIENKSFDITFGFDTKNNEDSSKILMKELMTLIYDENGEKLQIGTFISISEKIGKAVSFDKAVIEKAIDFIKSNEIDYTIAINLSILSVKDKEFMNWLHSLFLFDEDISKYLIFSITSYTASMNKDVFIEFVNEIHRFGAKVILKRYSSSDFKIEELDTLNLDYLRISKDYTTGIASDRDKKHFLRSVVNYGLANNTIIFGDGIKDAKDIEVCFSIGIDGISSL